ncbi:hypothetical protein ACIBI4_27695 [Streptomyces sp. NPDC050418]|uniref:hypothetical protein n=1 Tax=Streptomyces sp. NPDC050418 TaxID=3365612 RepID=UPI0037877A77
MAKNEAIDRYHPVAGTALLALTAANWLTSTREAADGFYDRDTSLWGMLSVVNEHIHSMAVLAVGTIAFCAFICMAFPLHRSHKAVLVSGVLIAVLSAAIMLNTDSGFSPGPGAWLTLFFSVVTTVTAAAALTVPVNPDGTPLTPLTD